MVAAAQQVTGRMGDGRYAAVLAVGGEDVQDQQRGQVMATTGIVLQL